MSKSIGKGNTKLRAALDKARRKFGSFDEDHIVRLLPLVGFMNGDERDLGVEVKFYQQAVRRADGKFENSDYTYARVVDSNEDDDPLIYQAPTTNEHKQRWPAEWAKYQASIVSCGGTYLTPHILNVALAAAGKREGDLREAKDALVREVARIAWDACSPGFKK